MKKRFLSFLILFLISGATSWAEPQVTETETFYDIRGGTIDQLFSAMHHGSGRSDGVAFTNWPISADPQQVQTPQGWAVTAANVKLAIKYKYPRWADEAQGVEEVRKRWDAFYQAERVHEHGHGAIAVEAARAMERALLAIPPKNDPRLLRWAIQAAEQNTVNVYEKKENDYDRQTEFGRKQGATF